MNSKGSHLTGVANRYMVLLVSILLCTFLLLGVAAVLNPEILSPFFPGHDFRSH
ncbi:MAG: hypothetical protein SFY67_09745 [Candidatus Melainabacteria bacterium]|nr:hypothetical protein [Candidatus Melainabacteria bacterium]